MKKTFLALIAFVTLVSSNAFANNDQIRADLIRAQNLINSALARLEDKDHATSRVVKYAQYICREQGTTPEVTNAINSVRSELKARCGERCTVIVDFEVRGSDCMIIGKAIR